MHRKEDLYQKAIALRYKGFSYNEILNCIPIGKGTISRWCCEILLTKAQKERLIEKQRNTPLIQRRIREAIQSKKEAKVWAKRQISKLSKSEQLLLISGILLYWAEGTKPGAHKGIEFTNTDPRIIAIMTKFFRGILNVPENKFRIMVRIGSEGNIEKAKKYWSRITKVPKRNFQRPEILKLTPNSKSLRKYPYGMCRISIYDVLMARKVSALIENFFKKFLAKERRKKKI